MPAELRGCVGYPTALLPLYRTIVETARAAAFDDPRFVAVTLAEAPQLLVSISVLSPLRPISPDAIEIDRHGLLITSGSHRGLLLPQVPLEHRMGPRHFPGTNLRQSVPFATRRLEKSPR